MNFKINTKIKILIYIILSLFIIVKGYLFSIKYTNDEKYNEYIVLIQSLKSVSEDKVSYYVKIGKNFNNKFILNIYKDKYKKEDINLNDYMGFKYGDFVKVKGKIVIPEKLNNPGEFDYKFYLYSNNIHGLINTYSSVKKVETKLNLKNTFLKRINDFKTNVNNLIDNTMTEKEAGLVKALVYGNKQDLDEDLKEKFDNISISHLLSVSGTHIISFMCILNFILRNKKQRNNVLTSFVLTISLIIFDIFTGFSISCIRASIMTISGIICKHLKLRNNLLKSLKISFFVILTYMPFSIFSIGFKLSYLSVIGIILFKRFIEEYLSKFKVKNNKVNSLLKFFYSTISITISVNLMIFPIIISTFNKIYLPIILPNLIMGVISIPIRIIGMIGVIFSFVSKVSSYIFFILKILIDVFSNVLDFLNKFSFSIPTKSMPMYFFVLYYFCILTMYLTLKLAHAIKSKKKDFASKYNLEKLLKILKTFLVFLIILAILFCIFSNLYSKYLSKYVYFFNVGQGEMSYVKYGKSSIIVDMGSLTGNLPFNVINTFFKKENINYVDILLLSHLDMDHISGVEEFVKKYNVGYVVINYDKSSNNYNSFIKVLKDNNIKIKKVKAKDKIKLDNILIDILLPDRTKNNSTNSNSIICTVSTKSKTILYTGDVDKKTEEKLINNYNKMKKIDILKVAHHGSKTSSSEKFIKKISPSFAVISAKKKYYGHPHEETLEVLEENNVTTLLTEQIGAIKFNLD